LIEKYIPDHILKIAKYYYNDPLIQRENFTKELKNQSGIYLWFNKINSKFYIGSGVNLSNRLVDYFQNWYLKKRKNLIIVRALEKYKMENFALVILEITDRKNIIQREQYWIDTLKPEYNLLQNASNSLGFKHSPESINKIKFARLGSKHTLEVRKQMSLNRKGKNAYWYGKTLSDETKNKLKLIALNRGKLHKPGFSVEVLDTLTGIKTIYPSLRKACESIGAYRSTIKRIQDKNKAKGIQDSKIILKKKRYILTILS